MSRRPECTPFYLVWNPNGRAPTFLHPTINHAETEAARLAELHPGQEFFVLLPSSSVVSAGITKRRFVLDDIPF